MLIGVFWYPFDFRLDGAFLRERLDLLERAPFTAYYYGTEFRAATEVLHKVLFFAPLGFLAGFAMVRFRWPRAVVWLLGLSVAGGMGAVIEAGQLALPGKNADITDWVLETLGGALGVWISLTIGKTTKRAPAGRALPRRAPVLVANPRRAMPSRSEDPPPPRSG